MSGAARGLCDANCHLHGQGDSFHVATCAAEIAREQLVTALADGRHYWDPEELRDIVADLLPVVDRIANERAAAALEAAAEDIRCTTVLGHIAERLERQAASLRASNGEGT